MKILFCSPNPLNRELGAPKILIEVAEELERIGWDCHLVDPTTTIGKYNSDQRSNLSYSRQLRSYLQQHATDYDVVEYDHGHLPYPRKEFAKDTLFVARSVLLAHHFEKISIPALNWKEKLKSATKYLRMFRPHPNTQMAQITVKEADLVNVANYDDFNELVTWGIPKEKIVTIPYGISENRRILFDSISSEIPTEPKIAFIGMFTGRKGAPDLPSLFQEICKQIPSVTFRLLGTAIERETVLNYFSQNLRERIEVISQFNSNKLPSLLADCSVGVFPSYIEGFGFGVLEMLAASVPVFAYDTPGPKMMLPPNYLIRPGDAKTMAIQVANLLRNKSELKAARYLAKQSSQRFCWRQIAQNTNEKYSEFYQKKAKAK